MYFRNLLLPTTRPCRCRWCRERRTRSRPPSSVWTTSCPDMSSNQSEFHMQLNHHFKIETFTLKLWMDYFKIVFMSLFSELLVWLVSLATHRCTVVFIYFYRGTWGCEKIWGSPTFVIYCICVTKFSEIFERVHKMPLLPHCVHLCFHSTYYIIIIIFGYTYFLP